MFDCLQEHNLRLKPIKCEFFWDEINYMAHYVSKEGVWPSKENLKAVAELTPPQTYMEIWAFLGSLGYYRWFIKGFSCILQPLHKQLSEEGAHKKSEQMMLMAEANNTFESIKKASLEAHVLFLLTLTSHFS